MIEITVPMLGQSGMEVKIETWFINEGEHINKGESLYELSNEKLNQEIESPITGVLKKIVKPVGEMVDPGDIVAYMEED